MTQTNLLDYVAQRKSLEESSRESPTYFIDFVSERINESEVLRLESRVVLPFAYSWHNEPAVGINRSIGVLMAQEAGIIDELMPLEWSTSGDLRRKGSIRVGVQKYIGVARDIASGNLDGYLAGLPTEGVLVAASDIGFIPTAGDFHIGFLLVTDFSKVLEVVCCKPPYTDSRLANLNKGTSIDEAVNEFVSFCSNLQNYRIAAE